MNKRWISAIIAFLLVMAWAGSAWALEPFQLSRYVTDQAGLLSSSEQQALAQELGRYHQATTNQIVIVTVPSLEDRELVEFTEELFMLNKPGQKGKDNGIILFVAKAERKVRIEVGYGLEGVVPDGRAGTIIREAISPRFQAGDYYGGLQAGVVSLIQAISPDYQGLNEPAPAPQRRDRSLPVAWIVALIIAGLVTFNGNRSNRMHQGRHRRGFSEPWYWGGGGGWSGGGGFGGGGGSDSGGFSGGGGNFGGGGASGDW